MLTMLTTGIKSGPNSGGLEGNGSDGIKSGAAGKTSGAAKKVCLDQFLRVSQLNQTS